MTIAGQPPVGGSSVISPSATGGSDEGPLVLFMQDLEKLMRETVDGEFFPDELRGEFRRMLDLLSDSFELVLAQLRQPGVQDYLRVVGLTDLPLEAKTGLYWRGRGFVGRVLRQPVRALHATFGAANMILGSLLVLPGVEKIKEVKDGIEVAIDLAELAKSGLVRDQEA
jgi:hypothetical protein